jgi:hypothetical protein
VTSLNGADSHHAKVDHDSIDEMMTSIAQASESLKWITHMVDTACIG